jgi:excisionase family DNA binding protein
MNQLALLPLDTLETSPSATREASARLVRISGRARQSPRTAVGAPGFLSVRAAAERLGLQPRSVRYLLEQGRLSSQRLGRMHFLPIGQVEAYRRVRRARARRRQAALA